MGKTEIERAGDSLKNVGGGRCKIFPPYDCRGRELRAITVTPTGLGAIPTIVVPSMSSTTIEKNFPVVSSLVDAVAHLSLHGGEAFRQPFVVDIDEGGYTGEGENATIAETHFEFASIGRTKITAYAELSHELQKLPSAPYAQVVFENILTSMRKLLTREIMLGPGIGADQRSRITGIFSDKATAIDPATDIEIAQITDTTLDEILLQYGGDEDVGDNSAATLILSKLDLLAFSRVRTSTRSKFYEIEFKGGNGGTISGVPFIINSACKPLSVSQDKGGAASGEYSMAYGHLSGYQLVEFTPLTVERSDDFKFRQGMSCFRGEAFVGGNVVRKNAFLRIRAKRA